MRILLRTANGESKATLGDNLQAMNGYFTVSTARALHLSAWRSFCTHELGQRL